MEEKEAHTIGSGSESHPIATNYSGKANKSQNKGGGFERHFSTMVT